jgi:hypothetical protein
VEVRRNQITGCTVKEPMRQLTCFLALALAVAALGTACFGSSTSAPSQPEIGRVTGTLLLVGGPAPGTRHVEPHQVFRVLAGSRVVRSIRSDSEGRFAFSLPAGHYQLTMGQNTPISPTVLDVAAGSTTHLPLRIEAM